MGEKTIETATLPDSQSIRYSKQFSIGSLFKSQNGSIWTANQYQDMKFKLYKAKFTSQTGSALFQNPTLDESNGYVPILNPDSITILPKKVILGITTFSNSSGILTAGRKISESTKNYNYGYIVDSGGPVSTVGIITGGFNYSNGTVQTYNITGNGSGLRLDITTVNGVVGVATVSPSYLGNGYKIGDVVGIVTSSVSSLSGDSARFTINGVTGNIDTL
ncbi:MAG: hypothetical protein ACO3UU_10230, partial [Minisyncoccia bacterium]